MRKSSLVTLILIVSLFAPFSGVPSPFSGFRTHAEGQSGPRRKMPASFQDHIHQPRTTRTTERVIFNVSGANASERTQANLEALGATNVKQLGALDSIVADVPTDLLEQATGTDDVTWVSPDQEVRSMATSTDNTSHMEVTTGASKLLPADVTSGGAGNGVGIAILDSGISPPDAAEFAGYKYTSSGGLLGGGGLLGTGVLSTSTLTPYNRIMKAVDFTGEGTTLDNYGHGTHAAGVAAGTGQASEDYASANPGTPTYGGIATMSNLISVRVLNSQGVGTVSAVISGIDWVIKNKSTYN